MMFNYKSKVDTDKVSQYSKFSLNGLLSLNKAFAVNRCNELFDLYVIL